MGGKRSKAKWSWRLGALLVGFVAFGGSVAVASIPDGNTIYTCRNLTTGALRVIDRAAGQKCVSGEARLDWTNWKWRGPWSSTATYHVADVVFYLGSSYMDRVAPPVGTLPTNGSYWSLIAAKGATGPRGLQGVRGATGARGATGSTGPQGAVGITGPRGLQGLVGATGAAGIDGVDGAVGATGPRGLVGPTGPAGVDGIDGVTGPRGVTGPAGVDGIDGATGPRGVTGPAGLDGIDGATGPRGVTGPAGLDGIDGIDGATGPRGVTGPAGIDGLDGATGATGARGVTGPSGIDGLDGATGATGARGVTGPSGVDGLNGATGATGAANGLLMGGSGTLSLGAPVAATPCDFVGIGAGVSLAASCTAPSLTQIPMPVGGTVKALYVNFAGAGGNNNRLTFAVRKNGTADTTTNCIPSGAAVTTCHVTGLNVAFNPGDLFDIQVSANQLLAPAVGIVTWSVQYQ